MSFRKSAIWLTVLILLLTEIPCLAEDTGNESTGTYTLPDGRSSIYRVKDDEECPFLAAGETPQITPYSYRSEDVCIVITTDRYSVYTNPDGKAEKRSSAMYYCADIYIRDIRCMERVYAEGRFKEDYKGKVTTLANSAGAILATNSDYACLLSQGVVIANGKVLRKTANKKRDMCVIRTDGTMTIIPYGTALNYDKMVKSGLLDENVWQVFLFGPDLLDKDGNVYEYKEYKRKTDVLPNNPRTVLGYYEPGHYCLVVADGRTNESLGLRIEALAQLMKELGCVSAYNLDGGQSSQMSFFGKIINAPYNKGRRVNDILIIRDLTNDERDNSSQ